MTTTKLSTQADKLCDEVDNMSGLNFIDSFAEIRICDISKKFFYKCNNYNFKTLSDRRLVCHFINTPSILNLMLIVC